MTLLEKVQDQIKEMIFNKKYDQNNFLPSEGDLCKIFNVSRATVREAVRSLEVRGFVKRVHGKGIQVIDNRTSVITRSLEDMVSMGDCSLEEIVEVRRVIEVQTAGFAAIRASERDIKLLKESLNVLENADVMDENYYNHDFRFHVNLVKASQNSLLIAFVNAYTPLLRNIIIESSHFEYNLEKKYHYHRNIYDSIVSKNPEKAAECMREHLKATSENIKYV